ncbi:pyruvate formate-lyase-activating protein [Butyrivibrio sp. NC3005]|uniref:pyruvate formate-lyase-activating protein n=1 Tax=Butyrivibrio sp. NC3005 TaxID=1280685 RepID=UPI0003F986F5|nr:pyruvate formate-lyase-activating protein [Butyrivibrio sp. NC3005]
MKGAVHSIETFGSVDGPGIRFIIFLQGCNMRCRYCHNADTWALEREDTQFMEADELLDRAERYKPYWGKEGGITVSGGEALLQIDFLLELFTKAKERGINTCIDTAGQPFTRQEPFFSKFEQLMKLTDLLLFDIKHIDKEQHKLLTGQDNENILDCMHYLSDIGKPIWIRHVLVPGITDDDEYLRRTRKFIETLSNVDRIEVLPYHNLGVYKFKELGIPYTLEDTKSPSKERVENAEQILRGQK